MNGWLLRSWIFWNQLNLKDTWPQFAGDKQALVRCIVGDPVQHRVFSAAEDWTEQAGEINPAHHLAALGEMRAMRPVCQTLAIEALAQE
jgi:hypothetical protein